MTSETLQTALTEALKGLIVPEMHAMEYSHTWKAWPMRQGCSIPAIRGKSRQQNRRKKMRNQERASSGSLSGWPTPVIPSGGRVGLRTEGKRQGEFRHLEAMPLLVGWPTSQARDGDGRGAQESRADGTRMNLDDYAQLAGWTTPQVRDHKGTDEARRENRTGNRHAGEDLPTQAAMTLAGWTTPAASEPSADTPDRPSREATGRTTEYLGRQVTGCQVAGWATPGCPRAHDSDATAGKDYPSLHQMDLTKMAALAPGPTSPSSTAATTSTAVSPVKGVLNPAFSLWLMSFPPNWLLCGLRAVAAARSSRKKSRGGRRSCEVPETQLSQPQQPSSCEP